MDELKITKGGAWSSLLSAFITKKLKKHGIKVSLNSVDGISLEDGVTKLHIDGDLYLTEAQLIKFMAS